MRRRIVAGNWKLHGDRAFATALVEAIAATPAPDGVERVVLPPYPYLAELAARCAGRGVALVEFTLLLNSLTVTLVKANSRKQVVRSAVIGCDSRNFKRFLYCRGKFVANGIVAVIYKDLLRLFLKARRTFGRAG